MRLLTFRFLAFAWLALCLPSAASAFDRAAYEGLIGSVAREIVTGKFADLDATLKKLDEAAAIATVAARERAAAVPADAKLMEFSISAPALIKKTPVDKLEEDWGDGAQAFLRAGFKRSNADQFKATESFSDLLVHPSTAWVYLTAWRQAPSAALLDLAKNELVEVLEHLKHAK